MSPAEITQQLGLQSLTRRAWVSIIDHPRISFFCSRLQFPDFLPVHPIDLRYHR